MAKVKAGEIKQRTMLRIKEVTEAGFIEISRRVIKLTAVGNPSLWKSPPPKGYTGGTAKGNWLASVDKPIASPNYDLVDPKGDETANNVAKVIENTNGKVYYLTNNMPYIRRLEYEGWSKQAPSGMVRVTLTELNVIFNEYKV